MLQGFLFNCIFLIYFFQQRRLFCWVSDRRSFLPIVRIILSFSVRSDVVNDGIWLLICCMFGVLGCYPWDQLLLEVIRFVCLSLLLFLIVIVGSGGWRTRGIHLLECWGGGSLLILLPKPFDSVSNRFVFVDIDEVHLILIMEKFWDFNNILSIWIDMQNSKLDEELSYATNKKHTIKFKVVFVGDQAVGKSSIINRFIKNEFDATHNVFFSLRSLLLVLILFLKIFPLTKELSGYNYGILLVSNDSRVWFQDIWEIHMLYFWSMMSRIRKAVTIWQDGLTMSRNIEDKMSLSLW